MKSSVLLLLWDDLENGPSPPPEETWYDEFGDEWRDENSEIWTTE